MSRRIWIQNDPCFGPVLSTYVEVFIREPMSRTPAHAWGDDGILLFREDVERLFSIDIPKDLGSGLLELRIDTKSEIRCIWEPI